MENDTTTSAKKKTSTLHNLSNLSVLGDVLIIILIAKSLTSDSPISSLENYLVIIIILFGLVVSIFYNKEIERANK
ncbi:MAG: hypothetical protein PHX30_02895 [Candidatus Pacebacteria bacterium]|nr:hypothetical protein [Candidatus Paceibacterota bacterium]